MKPITTAATPARAEAAELVRDLRGIDWLQLLETWGLKLLAAIAIFVLGRWLARRLSAGLAADNQWWRRRA